MNNKLLTLLVALLCVLGAQSLSAQISNNIAYQVQANQVEFEQLVIDELKSNDFFEMSNVQVTGAFGNGASVATFSDAQVPLGIEDGLILGTARIVDFIGGNTATGVGGNLALPGSPNLTTLSSIPTFDHSAIEFSFVPSQTTLSLEYIFASEEYCDFVGSFFNDVFGIFLSGPGIAGPYSVNGMSAINIAEFVDANGDSQLINVNNINNTINESLYIDNNTISTSTTNNGACSLIDVSSNQFTQLSQFDGWTVPLTATYDNLQIGETYHLQIAIADGGDNIFGSAIYLAKAGFNAGAPSVNLFADAGVDMQLDCIVPSVTLGGDSTSMDPEFSYEWIDEFGQVISTNAFVEVDIPGEYILNVESALTSEIASDTVTVGLDFTAPAVTAVALSNINCLNPEVSIEGNTDVANPDYLWEGPGGATILPDLNSKDIIVNTAGVYILTVTNLDNGCASSVDVEVLMDTETPQVNTEVSGVLTCDNINATLLANGDMANTYEWSFQGTIVSDQSEINVSLAGVYELEVTNANNGCTATTMIEVLEDIEEPNFSIATPDILNCFNQEVTLMGVTEVSNAAYLWQAPGPGGIQSGPTEKDIVVSQPGQYCLTVTNLDNGCTSSVCATVFQETESPQVDTQVSGNLTCVNETVTLSAFGEFSNAYEWFFQGATLGSQEVIEVGQPGLYELVVSNLNNGCTTITTVGVLEDLESPNATIATPEEFSCATTSVLLDASASDSGPNFTYSWFSFGTVLGNESTLEVDDCGAYQLEVRNTDNGCSTMLQVEVQCNQDIPVASIETPDLLMLGGELTLDAFASSGGSSFMYTWTTTNGNLVSGMNTLTPTINQPGTYCLTVLNADNLCESVACVDVQQNAMSTVIADAGPDQTLDCNSPSVPLGGPNTSMGPEFTYEWFFLGNSIATMPFIEVSSNGGFIFTVTNTFTGEQASDTVFVSTQFEFIGLNLSTPEILTCQNSSVTLDVFTELFYFEETSTLWETLDGNIISDPTQNMINVDQAGTYSVVVTNLSSGCTGSGTVIVEEDIAEPFASLNFLNQGVLNCVITSEILVATTDINEADATFDWTTPAGNVLSDIALSSIEAVLCGTYTLTVTNINNGCFTQASIIVACDTDLPDVIIGQPQTLDPGQSIVLDATASSTGANLIFTWTTDNGNIVSGGNSLTPTVDQTGVYCLSILNANNGCEETTCIVVQQSAGATVIADAGPGQELTCEIAAVTLDGSNSSVGSEFTYSWTFLGQEISDQITVSVFEPGVYTLTVINTLSNEQANDIVSVTSDDSVVDFTPIAPENFTCTNNIVSIAVQLITDPSLVSILWETIGGSIISDPTQTTIEVDQTGTYNVTLTNSRNGCLTIFAFEVLQDIVAPSVAAIASNNGLITCVNPTITIEGITDVDGVDAIFEWTTIDGNILSDPSLQNIEVGTCGTYIFRVTNTINGCASESQVEVFCNDDLPVLVIQEPFVLEPGQSIQLDASTSSTGPSFEYTWSTVNGNIVAGASTLTPTVDQAGEYCLTAVNASNGCDITSCVMVQQGSGPVVVADAGSSQTLTCNNAQVILDGGGSSVGTEFVYSWTDNFGNEISTEITTIVTEPGTYTLTVTNTQSGELASDTVEVFRDINILTANIQAPVPETLTCEISEVFIELNTDLDPSEASFLWQGPGIVSDPTQKDITANEAGLYEVVVTNISTGCSVSSTVALNSSVEVITITSGGFTITCADSLLLNPVDLYDQAMLGELTGGVWDEQDGLDIGDFPLATARQSGEYNFTGINPQTFCPVQITFIVIFGEQVTVDLGMDQDINCQGEEIILNAEVAPDDVPLEYIWSRDNIAIFTSGDALAVSVPGTYRLEVTNLESGCTSSDEIIITLAEDIFTVTPQVTDVSCFEANDGSIIFDISGGEEPYTFVGGFQSNTDLAPGVYPITIVDNLQCSFEISIEITEPDLLELDFDLTADGDLLANPMGGVPPYECSWSTGQDSCILFAPDFSTPIDLTLTDANGCVVLVENILEPTAVSGLQAEELNVFPNPADDYVMINQEGIASAFDNVKLVDLRGRAVTVSHTMQDQNNIKMNLQSLTPGIYFIHVILDQKLYYQKLIVH